MTKVLVVDDNAIVRAGLQAVLGRVDTVDEVLEAENAFTALEMTSAHSCRFSIHTVNCNIKIIITQPLRKGSLPSQHPLPKKTDYPTLD